MAMYQFQNPLYPEIDALAGERCHGNLCEMILKFHLAFQKETTRMSIRDQNAKCRKLNAHEDVN